LKQVSDSNKICRILLIKQNERCFKMFIAELSKLMKDQRGEERRPRNKAGNERVRAAIFERNEKWPRISNQRPTYITWRESILLTENHWFALFSNHHVATNTLINAVKIIHQKSDSIFIIPTKEACNLLICFGCPRKVLFLYEHNIKKLRRMK